MLENLFQKKKRKKFTFCLSLSRARTLIVAHFGEFYQNLIAKKPPNIDSDRIYFIRSLYDRKRGKTRETQINLFPNTQSQMNDNKIRPNLTKKKRREEDSIESSTLLDASDHTNLLNAEDGQDGNVLT